MNDMKRSIRQIFAMLLVCIFFLSATNSAFAANQQFIEKVRSEYSNLEKIYTKDYETYRSNSVKKYESYRSKQQNQLERFINQTAADQQKLVNALQQDANELEKRFGNSNELRAYRNKINPAFLGSSMNEYAISIKSSYLGSFMMQYKNEVNASFLNSAMMKYKNAVNQSFLNSPMMKYKNAVNPSYLNSPMMKLKHDSNGTFLGGIMTKYRQGSISQSEARKQWDQAREKEKATLQKLINESKASIKQIEESSHKTILQQQMKSINGILKQRAKTLEEISKFRASNFGGGISFDPLIPDLGVINVFINGEWLGFEQPPKIEYGTTLVPMRAIFEELGANVTWNQKTKGISASKGSTKISLTLNQKTAKVNGKTVTLTVPPKAINGHTLVPLRFVSEALGADVKWDGSTETIFITK